ncbi:MAG TPA: peptidoglycan DD-metalloendopeptidase family protein [Anaerolineales bacterium]|nr:peptidoglycan DD-metalloendopeptidase family protein [Anaerolineales bacterium]
MKRIFFAFLVLSLTACSPTPQAIPTETPTSSSPTPAFTATPAFTKTPSPTETPVPPTATPIPCNPQTAEYCITGGNFVFQRPILLPGNDLVDLTYLYGTTQNGTRDPHHGDEFQNPFGTPVHAAGDGEVVFADSDKAVKFSPWNNFYGNVVVIQHTDGLHTLYAHLSKISVKVGDHVKVGDVIGEVGATGGATGSHLHFEVRKGDDYTQYFSTENPELWLLPQSGAGALSITLGMDTERNYERPLVITRLAEGSDEPLFVYYVTSYTKGFEHNAEDAVLNNLPSGLYKVAFNDPSGLRERIVQVEAGKLTEVFFGKQ